MDCRDGRMDDVRMTVCGVSPPESTVRKRAQNDSGANATVSSSSMQG